MSALTKDSPSQGINSKTAVGGSRQQDASDQLQLVTFEVGSEQFAIDILSVQEINRMMQITRVPQSPDCLEGVINLRGRIIPVIDLRKRFGLSKAECNEDSRIVVVEVVGRVLGFIVDRVNEVLRVDNSIVDAAPAMTTSVERDYIRGVAKLENRLVILLDLARLFANEKFESGGSKQG
ncbi:MAG: chemotaxis protein CheW [Planctomycetota bacterium]|nr:chemotaxis protein CheW [Planctomycetota bacterium]